MTVGLITDLVNDAEDSSSNQPEQPTPEQLGQLEVRAVILVIRSHQAVGVDEVAGSRIVEQRSWVRVKSESLMVQPSSAIPGKCVGSFQVIRYALGVGGPAFGHAGDDAVKQPMIESAAFRSVIVAARRNIAGFLSSCPFLCTLAYRVILLSEIYLWCNARNATVTQETGNSFLQLVSVHPRHHPAAPHAMEKSSSGISNAVAAALQSRSTGVTATETDLSLYNSSSPSRIWASSCTNENSRADAGSSALLMNTNGAYSSIKANARNSSGSNTTAHVLPHDAAHHDDDSRLFGVVAQIYKCGVGLEFAPSRYQCSSSRSTCRNASVKPALSTSTATDPTKSKGSSS